MTAQGTILLAEDDMGIAEMVTEILTEEGYAVQLATTGSAALAALQSKPLDLALVDLHMPSMSGLDLLEAMQEQQIDVPIVLMTASSLDAELLAAAGARACLYKPFELDALLECVAQHIRQSHT